MIIIKIEYLKNFQDQDHSKTTWTSKWKIKTLRRERETSLRNRNIYRTTDQTNSTPAIIIRLIVIHPFHPLPNNRIWYPSPIIRYTSLHHRVNTASRFRQTLKNNQNFWAHCRLINLSQPISTSRWNYKVHT